MACQGFINDFTNNLLQKIKQEEYENSPEVIKEKYEKVANMLQDRIHNPENLKYDNEIPHEDVIDAFVRRALYSFRLHPCTFKIVQTERIDFADLDYPDDLSPTDLIMIENIRKNVNHKIFTEIPDTVTKMVLINLDGGNTDNRSKGCDGIPKWEYYFEVPFSNQLTFVDFTKLIYRTKGSYYDFWYELYCGFYSRIEGDTIYIATTYDHGS